MLTRTEAKTKGPFERLGDGMDAHKLKFGVGGIRPNVEGYGGKFILALKRKGPISEVLLYADSSKGYHKEIADSFKVPRSSVIGGGKMEDNFEKVNSMSWPSLKKTETGLYLYDSSGDFGPVPFELVTLCLQSKFDNIRTGFNGRFSTILMDLPGKNDHTGWPSRVTLEGLRAIDLFLARKGVIDRTEIKRIVASVMKELGNYSEPS
jgi:hypothetical protein